MLCYAEAVRIVRREGRASREFPLFLDTHLIIPLASRSQLFLLARNASRIRTRRSIDHCGQIMCNITLGYNPLERKFRSSCEQGWTCEWLASATSFDRNRATIRHGCPTISITSETGQSIPRVTTIVFPRDYCHAARVCK